MPLIKVGGFARHRGVLAFFAFHPDCALRQKHQEQSASPSVSHAPPPTPRPPRLFPLPSLALCSPPLTTLLFGTPGARAWLPSLWPVAAEAVPVRLPWLAGAASRPSVGGLAVVGFEGSVLAASVL